MDRSDVVALFVVSFIAGTVLATLVLLVVDLPEESWPGLGGFCAAGVAAFLYQRQRGRPW